MEEKIRRHLLDSWNDSPNWGGGEVKVRSDWKRREGDNYALIVLKKQVSGDNSKLVVEEGKACKAGGGIMRQPKGDRGVLSRARTVVPRQRKVRRKLWGMGKV